MDPLADLKTIHLPEQIAQYPLAYGWWILLVSILMLTAWGLIKYRKHRQHCQAKKQAMQMIQENKLDAEQLISLLKWAAMQYFERQQIASLTGEGLQAFLVSCLPIKQQPIFIERFQPALEKRYQRDELLDNHNELTEAVMLWLKHALPAKQSTQKSNLKSASMPATKIAGAN
ncbi:DUF4381 domain-containing protein [Thalassotalea sp. SU-HH00458]|uniref:DUF4381 domain-containing protein n=1 Tax=Thalassotalea sp. SU-HH00458 TaxID=3127657 RepID=UPI003109D53D